MWACTVAKAPWNTIRCIITFACTATLGKVRGEHAFCGNFQCSALVDFITAPPPKRQKKKNAQRLKSEAVIKYEDEEMSRAADRCLHKSRTVENKTRHSLRSTGSYSCNPAPLHDRTQYNSIEMLSSMRNLKLQLAVASTWVNRTLEQINLHRDVQNGLLLKENSCAIWQENWPVTPWIINNRHYKSVYYLEPPLCSQMLPHMTHSPLLLNKTWKVAINLSWEHEIWWWATCLNNSEVWWPAVSTTYLQAKQANSSGALLFPQWALIHLILTDCFETSRAGKRQCVLSFSFHRLFWKTFKLPGSKECAAMKDCRSF